VGSESEMESDYDETYDAETGEEYCYGSIHRCPACNFDFGCYEPDEQYLAKETMQLTTKNINLLSALLELAANKFSSHGCNDFNLAEYLPDVDDRREFMQHYHEWNGDTEEFDPDGAYEIVQDGQLISYFSAAVKNIIKANS
jgi:hypothetical protein